MKTVSSSWVRIRRFLIFVLIVKTFTLLIGCAALHFYHHKEITLYRVFSIWNRMDMPHYLDLARYGYNAGDASDLDLMSSAKHYHTYIVFFPLYPWVLRIANFLIENLIATSFLVSGLFTLLIPPVFYQLANLQANPAASKRAIWFLFLFPTAYFLHIGYPESLFLFLSISAFLAAKNKYWLLAGVLGGLSALSRINGITLFLCLIAEAYAEWRKTKVLNKKWCFIALIPLGFTVYLFINWDVYGSPFQFLIFQKEHWNKFLSPPWEGIIKLIEAKWTLKRMTELTFIAIGLAGTVYAYFRFPLSWFLWMVQNWLLFVSTNSIYSVPRFSLVLFPLFIALGQLTERISIFILLSLITTGGYLFFSYSFVTKYWPF